MGKETTSRCVTSKDWDFSLLGELHSLSETVSAVIATYNRCPFPPGYPERNPLELLFQFLLSQRSVELQEILVVDDASGDHTREVVEYYRLKADQAGVDLRYIRNPSRQGSAASRNLGIEAAQGRYIYLTDDDCVPTPYALYGGLLVAREFGGVVDLPVYYRATVPLEFRPLSQIGKVEFSQGVKSGGLDAFPREYLRHPSFFDRRLRIYMPLKIQDLNANFLAPTEVLDKAGGFPEDLPWRNSFSEESELAVRLQETGYPIWLLPDPKFHAVHLRFGNRKQEHLIGPDWSGGVLAEAIKWANLPREDTGNRLDDPQEYYRTKILANFRFFQKRDAQGAVRYLLRQLETEEEFDGKYYPVDEADLEEIRAEIEGLIGEQALFNISWENLRGE